MKPKVCSPAWLFAAIAFAAAGSSVAQNTPLTGWNVKAFNAKGDNLTDDTWAFRQAIAACAASADQHCTIHVPAGNYLFSPNPKDPQGAPLTDPVRGLQVPAGKSISFVGDHERTSALIPAGFSAGQTLLTYGAPSQCIADPSGEIQTPMIEIRNLLFLGTGAGNGLALNCVTKSVVDRVLFQSLTNAISCVRSTSNTFSNLNTFALAGASLTLGTDCNNTLVLGGAFGSASHGILVEGALNGLSIVGSNCESVLGNCITITPDVTPHPAEFVPRVDGVSVLNTHFENVVGAALYVSAPSADSVRNLKFDNNVVAGGAVEHANSSTPNRSSYALILRSTSGFEVTNNVFSDWELSAIWHDSAVSRGAVERNTLTPPGTTMTLVSPALPASVRVTNNARLFGAPEPIGRQESFVSAAPVGNCGRGDISWNTLPVSGAPVGWVCAGSPASWKSFGAVQ